MEKLPLPIAARTSEIDFSGLVEERLSQQNDFISDALRKGTPMRPPVKESDDGQPTPAVVRRELVYKLRQHMREAKLESRVGAIRASRWISEGGALDDEPGNKKKVKKTVAAAVRAFESRGTVSQFQARESALASFKKLIHDQFPIANISCLTQLQACTYILALTAGKKKRVVFGKGM